MRISIKTKIIISMCLVVLIALVCSGAYSYYYFTGILKDQAVRDDKAKLEQTVRQLNYISDDIVKFAYLVLIDADIQELLRTTYYQSIYDQQNVLRRSMAQLGYFLNMRDYMQSAAIAAPDGNIYWNIAPSDDYFKSTLNEVWYNDYKNNKSARGFTPKHTIELKGEKTEVISYIIPLKNINEPDKILGQLILNINLDYFRKLLDENSKDFEGFIWQGQHDEIIYSNGEDILLAGDMAAAINVSGEIPDYPQMNEREEGYVLRDTILENHWTFVLFTSKKRLFERIGYVFYIILLVFFLSLVFMIAVMLPLIFNFTKPITSLRKAMEQVSAGNLDAQVRIHSRDELEVLGNGFNRMVGDLKEYIQTSLDHEKAKRNMEFGLLLSQINPHFIYNTLNAVIYFARKQGNDDIVKIMSSFIHILQDSVKINEESVTVTLEKEMEIVNHYITIQKYRYMNRIELVWDVEDSLKKQFIPRASIQPLIENALLHGTLLKEEKGIIRVSVKQREKNLEIIVEDNGVGMDEERIMQVLNGKDELGGSGRMRSIGIPNIMERIKFLFGNQADLKIESRVGQWTRVIIHLPVNEGQL